MVGIGQRSKIISLF